eukprot:scaffold120424_cov57-Phaeocystis_antarctica.AAC.2
MSCVSPQRASGTTSLTSCPAIAAPKTRPVGPPSVPAIGPGAMPMGGGETRGRCDRPAGKPRLAEANRGQPRLTEAEAGGCLWPRLMASGRLSILEAERPGQRVDARLGGAGVGLEGQRLVVQRRRDVDHKWGARGGRPTPRAGEGAERSTAHVVSALQVDVDDGAEGRGRELLGGAHEVASGAVDKDIQPTVLTHARSHRRCARVGLAHVAAARRRNARGPAFAQRAAAILQDCRTAAEEGQACAVSGERLRDAEADPRATAGHQDHQATQAVIAEGRLGLRSGWLPRDHR